jgi:crotonobetainyl-CoA hydratase
MSYEYIYVQIDGAITTITINRPTALNALNQPAHYELATAFDCFAADPTQWVAIITGAGTRAFCAGHDLKQQASGGGMITPGSGFAGLTARFDLTKPVIAAVNGAAMGGGFEAALACDLIIASENAVFALPEVRVGLAALSGGMYRLPREIGLKKAMGMLLTGRRVSAREGFELGFVNEVVSEDALGAAKRCAKELLTCSPLSIRATKEAVIKGLSTDVADSISAAWNYPAIKSMLDSEDAVEGPRAFGEKRVPAWKGR